MGKLSRRGRGPAATRRLWVGSLAVLLPLVLALVALGAPIGQAHPARERTPEEEASRAAGKQAEREQRSAERQAQREQAATRSNGKPIGRGTEREDGSIAITCTSVTWSYRNFPDLRGNTVSERIAIGHEPATVKTFTFDGTEGTDVVAINAPPGPQGHAYHIDAWAKWHTNGVRGGFDIPVKVKCAPAPGLAIEKLQRIPGSSSGAYTSSGLIAEVGQTVEYEILARNTGNVPLSLGSFTDAHCDEGTISGGPGAEQLAAGASSTYLCTHLLSAADETAGSYSNTVSLTGTPPDGEGSPISQTSNTVVVEVVAATPPHREEPQVPPTTITTTTTTSAGPPAVVPASGVLPATATQPPRSGVLAFTSATVPRLNGPQGCVRGRFRASVKVAGVASVIFYLDGRRLGRLTAHSARRGLLTIMVDPSKLRVGPHRLLARITMLKAPSASRAVTASRSMTVLRCRSAALTPKFTG